MVGVHPLVGEEPDVLPNQLEPGGGEEERGLVTVCRMLWIGGGSSGRGAGWQGEGGGVWWLAFFFMIIK